MRDGNKLQNLCYPSQNSTIWHTPRNCLTRTNHGIVAKKYDINYKGKQHRGAHDLLPPLLLTQTPGFNPL